MLVRPWALQPLGIHMYLPDSWHGTGATRRRIPSGRSRRYLVYFYDIHAMDAVQTQ